MAGADLAPTDDQRADAQRWLVRTRDEVTGEYTAGLIRYLLARAEVATLDALPGCLSESHDLFHLARSLKVAGADAQSARIHALCAPEDRKRALIVAPETTIPLLRSQWEWGIIGRTEQREIGERIWSHARYLIEHGDYAEAVALADAWRAMRGMPMPATRPDAASSRAACERVVAAWNHALYQPTLEEGLARIGYMDEGDVLRAGHARATGDVGIFGDPRGAHRGDLFANTGVRLAEFERMARAAIDHPELFGGADGPRAAEEIQLPLHIGDLREFAEQYADDPSFLGWSIGYAITPAWAERFEDSADAHYKQAVYLRGHLRAQTPSGERSVTACLLIGHYNTDEPDTALAAYVGREYLAQIGARSDITGPMDDTVARLEPAGVMGGGRLIEGGSDLIRTPECAHLGAVWQPARVVDQAQHDSLSLDCPDCGERRIATVPLHRAPDARPARMDAYLRHERMHTHLQGAPVARDWRALQRRDEAADMSLEANLPGVAPLRRGDDLMTTLFG